MRDNLVAIAVSMEDPEFSDAVVKHGDKEWQVHRLVLCSKSLYFRKALTGAFAEKETRTVDLSDHFTLGGVERMLRFLYGSSYRGLVTGAGQIEDPYDDVVMNEEMYRIGDYFAIKSLAEQALQYLKVAVGRHRRTKETVSFCDLIQEIHKNDTPEAVTAVFAGECQLSITSLIQERHFRTLLANVPGLAIFIVDSLCQQRKEQRELAGAFNFNTLPALGFNPTESMIVAYRPIASADGHQGNNQATMVSQGDGWGAGDTGHDDAWNAAAVAPHDSGGWS